MSDDDKSLPESLITPEQVQSTFSAAPIHEEPKPEEKVETPDETLPDMITPDVVKSTFSREPIKALNKVEQFASQYEKGDINQISPEETRVMSLWTPQEWHDLKKLRPDLAIPDNKAREIFDAKRAGQIVDKEGPGLLTQLGQGAKSFVHGVGLLFEDKNPYVKDPVTGEYPISDVERLRALGSAPLKVGEAANYLAAHAINEPIPSLWGFTDWVGEKLGHQTPDDTFKKEQARNLIDTARAADERAHQSIYSRYAQTPAVKNAIKGGLTLLGADKDTSPEALDNHAQKIANRWSEAQNYPVNPDIELVSSFLAPKGLGMEDFAVATTALGAFQKALKIPAAIRGVEAEQALQARKTLDAVDKASKVGVFPKAAGKTADALDNLSTSLEEFKKARPYTAGVLSTVPGVILGSQMDKEHPIAGAVLGGLGEGAAVKYLGKAAASAPRILADLGEARAMTAGGGKLFETAGAAAEKGSATEKIFGGFKGRTLDKLSDLATSYGRGGIDMLGLGAALGAIKGEDWEDTKNAMGQGLAYGLFHQTLGKMMGQDPIVQQRNLHRKDIEFTKQLQQMSPETQDTVLHFQDWNTYTGLLQQQLSDAHGRYGEAVKSGDKKAAAEAGNLVRQLSDQLQRGSTADLHTRQAYARSIGDLFTDALRTANGSFREGQKNIGMEILNTNQIAQKLQANNPGMTPQAAQGIANMGHFFSQVGGGRGIELGGNIPDALKPVVEGKVFDPLKSTVVMNADLIKDGIVNRNQTPAEAFRHEWGHALWSIPEFKDLMIANGVEEGLFDTTYTDLNGNPQRVTQGQFSNKDLNNRFWDEYLKNIRQDPGETQKQAQERYAKNLGMWDDSNKRWNEDKIADYMKNEVRADVYGKGLGGTGLDSLDSVSQHILDWTRVKVKNSLAKRAVEGILGHGGSDPYNSISSPATGVNNLSPELLSAYRNAFREFKDLNGQVTQSNDEGRIMPVISPLKMAKSASLRQKYGRDSGLFKTEFRATVYDKDGKPTGSVTLPSQNIFEGVWGSEGGSLVQRSGYGAAPADIEGMPVPPGGTIKISREIVMKPDGETPEMLSRKEIKDLAKTRAQTIRDAIDTAYKGEPNGFRSVSEDGLTYRGTFTPEQIAAIRALPEAVVPAKIKDTILRFNDLLAKGEGHRMLIDYAARVDDKGRAVAFSPKTYDLVPIGMHFSKDGNFLVTTVSVSRLLDKLNLWGDRFSGRLALWGGDKEAFFREFATKYLPNHLEKWQNPEGPDKPLVARPGETELDPDPKVALQKKHVFNDFLNLTSNEFRDRNPDRTIIPRRKGDPRGKFPDRTIMSVRADAVADMLESSAHPLPVNYELQKWNFMPAKEPGLSFAPKGDEPALKPTEENSILKALNVVTPEKSHAQKMFESKKGFFTSASEGTAHKSGKPFVPVLAPADETYKKVEAIKLSHSGNFDDHIKKSIPTFHEAQIGTLTALSESLPKGSSLLDLAASEGSYGKALTEASGGNVSTVSLDPNQAMSKFFREHSEVPGATYSTDALGANWVEDDGTVVNKYENQNAFDAVHESMGFQFISPDREGQVAEVKKLLKPDGIFLTEQKFNMPKAEEDANELKKDTEFKSQFWTPEELQKKQAVVGFNRDGTPKADPSLTMVENQVTQPKMEEVLKNNFAHVAQYWDSGNFKGYVASDSIETLQRFLDNLPSLKSKFSTAEIPRMITETQAETKEGPSYLPAASYLPPNISYLPAKKLTAQHPSKEKKGSVGGELDLVHFGPYGIKTTDPKKFGKGIATPVDLQGDYKTYFYLNDGKNYEYSMRGKVPYVAKVDGNSIYNLEQDPLGVNSMPSRLKRDETIQEAGYAGYFSPKSFNGSFDAVALYKPTKLTEVQEGKEIFKSKKQSKDFGMQFMPAKKLDEAHASAIESGDTEEAQRMVDEAAKKEGLIKAFHGTWHPNHFFQNNTYFSESKLHADSYQGLRQSQSSQFGNTEKIQAKNWLKTAKRQTIPVYLDLKNTAILPDTLGILERAEEFFDRIGVSRDHLAQALYNTHLPWIVSLDKLKTNPYWYSHSIFNGFKDHSPTEWIANHDTEKLSTNVEKLFKELGFDSIKFNDRVAWSYEDPSKMDEKYITHVVFDPSQIKSAAPATYDDEGKLIPLSQRFNQQSNDIRFMPAKKGVDGEPETEERVAPYTNEPKNTIPTGAPSAQNYPAAQGSGAEDSGKRESERLRFHSGLAAVARAASSSSEEGLPGAKGAVPRKELEEQALRDHADEHGLWTDPEAFFKQWQFDGSEAGGEHQVSFPSGPDVIKRTYNPYYPTWSSYFDAMNVHNTLFPKAALTFRGFQDVKGSGGVDIYQGKWPAGLYSEVSQPTLEIARGLKMDETDAMMEPLGFYRVRPMEYYNPELKIHMTDLHPQNAVMLRDEKGNEFPYVIDSNIHATGTKASDSEDVAKVEAKLAAKENPILSALQPPAPEDTGFSFMAAKGRPGITAATELAKEKVDELKTKLESADDDFFTKLWPSLLKKTGLTLKASSQNLGKAASIAVNDVVDWLKTNKKYQDYYHTDRETTKQLLKQEYPDMTEDDFKGFMMFMGLTSPSTKLKENVGEALRVFDLWKNEGSVKSLSLIKTPKGNAGVGSGPFKLIGPTAANKLRTLHYMEDLHKKLGSWDEVSKHLQEPVSMKELNAFNRELGYSGGIGKAGEVKQVVKEATGQDQLIPRMFVFGPKVGAYTLNHVGDDRYTTTDIWEGRFVRSHFPEMFKKGSGLPTNVSEHKIFQTFSSKFNETFKEKTGLDLSPAALQAARWFFMIAKANEAGYKHAKTNGTISEYTEEALRKLRSRTFDADREGSNQEDSEGVE
jgi:ubiquinone/menaquinone biosynthesis C-methylase UbiE